MKWAYNVFFEGKKAIIARSLWQERSGIISLGTSGISPIDAIRENSCSNSQEIATAICSGCIKPGSGTV
jgi:hypothetical protein